MAKNYAGGGSKLYKGGDVNPTYAGGSQNTKSVSLKRVSSYGNNANVKESRLNKGGDMKPRGTRKRGSVSGGYFK